MNNVADVGFGVNIHSFAYTTNPNMKPTSMLNKHISEQLFEPEVFVCVMSSHVYKDVTC